MKMILLILSPYSSLQLSSINIKVLVYHNFNLKIRYKNISTIFLALQQKRIPGALVRLHFDISLPKCKIFFSLLYRLIENQSIELDFHISFAESPIINYEMYKEDNMSNAI
jgi:hypothetical protein